MNNSNRWQFSLAGKIIEVTINYPDYFLSLKNLFSSRLTLSKCDYRINLLVDSFSRLRFEYVSEREINYYFRIHQEAVLGIHQGIIILSQMLILPEQIVLIHGSSLAVNDRGYLFIGPSGIGKSTIAQKGASLEQTILSDDAAVIKKSGLDFWIYPSSFDAYKASINPQLSPVKLHKFFVLSQSSADQQTVLGPRQKLKVLEEHNFLLNNLPKAAVYNHFHSGRILAKLIKELSQTIIGAKQNFTKECLFLKSLDQDETA